MSVAIDGITEQHKPLSVLRADSIRNRTRHLSCVRNDCEEFTILHLGFLEYAHYIITVRFYGLETFHQKYNIHTITFYVSFTQITEQYLCSALHKIYLSFIKQLKYLYIVLKNFPSMFALLQFKTYSPEFTQIEIWFRFIFLLFTFIVIVSKN